MSKFAFILFHTGETRALKPTILKMANRPEKYSLCIIPVGQAAKDNLADSKLKDLIKIPNFVHQGEGSNQEYLKEFSSDYIQQVVSLCRDYDNIVIGFSARIQEQIAAALPLHKQRIIYFDMGSNAEKIRAFAPFANMLVFTSLPAQTSAQLLVDQLALENKLKVVAGRHGDFDFWLDAYKKTQPQEIQAIRAQLAVSSTDKVILWAGGYGESLSTKDQEASAFKRFIEEFKAHQKTYKLRITIHPGVKRHAKVSDIQEAYYLTSLRAAGLPTDEISKMITSLETRQVAYVALGIFSLGSSVALQGIMVGARAKYIVPGGEASYFGIENVTPQKLGLLLHRWIGKDRRLLGSSSHQKATQKLGIPATSTKHAIKYPHATTNKSSNNSWLKFSVKALTVGLGLFIIHQKITKRDAANTHAPVLKC